MSYIVKAPENDGKGFSPIPAGSYGAICYAIIGVGSQYSDVYDKYTRKVIIIWELPDETITIDGIKKPRAISEQYSESLAEKSALRAMLEGWRGKAFASDELRGFDISKLVGVPCMISVKISLSKKNNEFAKVSGVSKLPKGITVSDKTFNDPIVYSVDEPEAFEKMSIFPEWIQERIRQSKEYQQWRDKDKPHIETTGEFLEIDSADDGDLPF